MVDLQHELRRRIRVGARGGISGLLAEQQQPHGAIDRQHRREPRRVGQTGLALELGRNLLELVGLDADIDIKVQNAAIAGLAAILDQLDLRDALISRLVGQAGQLWRDRHVVVLQLVLVIGEQRDPVDHIEWWVEI